MAVLSFVTGNGVKAEHVELESVFSDTLAVDVVEMLLLRALFTVSMGTFDGEYLAAPSLLTYTHYKAF
jgi:hypothetical protein